MARSLRSYEDVRERKQVIKRRLKGKTDGLGYLSAVAAAKVYQIQDAAEAKAAAEAEQVFATLSEAVQDAGDTP